MDALQRQSVSSVRRLHRLSQMSKPVRFVMPSKPKCSQRWFLQGYLRDGIALIHETMLIVSQRHRRARFSVRRTSKATTSKLLLFSVRSYSVRFAHRRLCTVPRTWTLLQTYVSHHSSVPLLCALLSRFLRLTRCQMGTV